VPDTTLNTISTVAASSLPTDPTPTCAPLFGRSVWYKYMASSPARVRLQTADPEKPSNFDTVIAVYQETPDNLVEIACNNDDVTRTGSDVDFTPEVGKPYWIMVAGNNDAGGDLNLKFTRFPTPANATPTDAMPITLPLPFTARQDTTGAPPDPAGYPAVTCGNRPNHSVWFRYTAVAGDTEVTFQTINSDYDTVMTVWTGDPAQPQNFQRVLPNPGNPNDCVDSDDMGVYRGSRFILKPTAGTTYYIRISGYYGSTGNLRLEAFRPSTVVPANDEFRDAKAITYDPETGNYLIDGSDVSTSAFSADTTNTRRDDAFPPATYPAAPTCSDDIGHTLWYRYQAPAQQRITFDTADSNFDTVVVAYVQRADGRLVEVGCNDDFDGHKQARLALNTDETVTLYLMFGGYRFDRGNQLNIRINQVLPQVFGFNLLDATQGLDLGPLYDQSVYSLGSLPSQISIRANTDPALVGSVRFQLDGQVVLYTANDAPYLLRGRDQNGKYIPWTPTVGTHVLRATAYTGPNATGKAGPTRQITFTIRRNNTAPVVDAGLTQRIVLPQRTASLKGTATDDGLPNASLTTTWTAVNPPGALSFADPDRLETTATFGRAGTYQLRLQAFDGEFTQSDTMTVIVEASAATNQPPTAVISSPQAGIITAGSGGSINLVLNGASSTDPEDTLDQLGFGWYWTANGAPQGAAGPTTTATFGVGTYQLTLSVADSLGAVGTATVNFEVVAPQNQPPVVDAGVDTFVVLPNTLVLNGSALDDGLPSTGALTHVWTVVSGPGPVSFSDERVLAPVVSFAVPGTYVLELSASDGEFTRSDTVTITVRTLADGNAAPIAEAGPDATIKLPTNTITLQGRASDDGLPAGSTLTVTWASVEPAARVTFNDVHALTAAATFEAAGIYQLRLTASDGELSSSDTVTITVLAADANQTPKADAGPDQTVTDTDGSGSEPMTLDGSGSSDADGFIVEYRWTENGDTLATTVQPTVDLKVGIHTITLVVVDDGGAQNIDQVIIRVLPTTTEPPVLVSAVNSASDGVNEDGPIYTAGNKAIWIGNGQTLDASYTGLRFTNIKLPPGTHISEAHIEFYSPAQNWINTGLIVAAEAADNSLPFSPVNRPSERTLTSQTASFASNANWAANQWHSVEGLAPVVQAILDRPGWQSGNSIALILKGNGTQWGRRFLSNFASDPRLSPRLVIHYSASGPAPVNQPPLAYSIDLSTLQQQAVAVEPLMYASDPDGDPLLLVETSAPANGSVVLTDWQKARYTPNPGFVGTDTFTYTVCDLARACATGTVAIHVLKPNLGPVTLDAQIGASGDDVNEDGPQFQSAAQMVWLGSGQSVDGSYTGLRFTQLDIPPGATIISAHLEVYTQTNSWNRMQFTLNADAADNSLPFSPTDKPSGRQRTLSSVAHFSDNRWEAGRWYALDEIAPVIQEVVSRPGWRNDSSLSLILNGAGGSWGRKFVTSYDGNPAYAPRLVVVYGLPPGSIQSLTANRRTAAMRPLNLARPFAIFSASVLSGSAPLQVQFTDNSSGVVSAYQWDFGDGSTSTERSPSHIFAAPGEYTVTLTVSGKDGTNSAQVMIGVDTGAPTTTAPTASVPTATPIPATLAPAPVAALQADTVSGAAPLTVQFTSTSSGSIQSYSWNFGDGNISAEANPVHTFNAGSYTVILTVTGEGGSSSMQMIVNALPPAASPQPETPPPSASPAPTDTPAPTAAAAPTAAFTPSAVSGDAPLTIQFVNTSSGDISAYQWDFGDGSTSSEASPAHSYRAPGQYTVTLIVAGGGGSSTAQASVTVSAPQQPETIAAP
jgi:PKD repeat protein